MKRLAFALLSVSFLVGCEKESTPTPPTSVNETKPPPAADNSGVNVRDRQPDAKTPISQNENAADVKTTADIRRRIVDKQFSINAQNAKIITQDGKVTLRGPVKSQEEKDALGAIATDIAGAGNVDNQLDVQPGTSTPPPPPAPLAPPAPAPPTDTTPPAK
jgi:hyperosmotically inducible protein